MDAISQTYVLHERNLEDFKSFIVYLIQVKQQIINLFFRFGNY